MYQKLTDSEFIELIFMSEDLLDKDYVEEAIKRKHTIVPFLCKVLNDEKNYKWDKESRWWSVVHAVNILGMLSDPRAIDALLSASRFAFTYDIDWIWEALSECYLRIGPTIIPYLKNHITEMKGDAGTMVISEISGLWNIWESYPETRNEIEDFFYNLIVAPDIDYVLRTQLIADFAQISREDLRSLFEQYYDKGEIDLEILTREDLDYFFDNADTAPGQRYDLEKFYRPEEIKKRRRLRKEEKEKSIKQEFEDFIIENLSEIERDEPCPCGSGKKFNECHLTWAEKEYEQRKLEKAKLEQSIIKRYALMEERKLESELRRFFAAKELFFLFEDLKKKALDIITAPDYMLKSKKFLAHFEPIFSQMLFENQKELDEFTGLFMDYYNALALQYMDYPTDKKSFH